MPWTPSTTNVASRWFDAMDLALAQAMAVRQHGDVPVGAVVLGADGQVVAAAGNERELTGDSTAHAEILAIRRAAVQLGSWRLSGCTLVVTLEPCTMCAGAIVAARLDRLVFGCFDEKAGAVASLWDVVRDPRLNHRPAVVSGVREAACSELLADFFTNLRTSP